jgi:hypothetical protein
MGTGTSRVLSEPVPFDASGHALEMGTGTSRVLSEPVPFDASGHALEMGTGTSRVLSEPVPISNANRILISSLSFGIPKLTTCVVRGRMPG